MRIHVLTLLHVFELFTGRHVSESYGPSSDPHFRKPPCYNLQRVHIKNNDFKSIKYIYKAAHDTTGYIGLHIL